MSAQDRVYLHEDGHRVELLVDPGRLHVVELPRFGPARRSERRGFHEPDDIARPFLAKGFRPIREQPVARVLIDIAPDVIDRVERARFADAAWARRLSDRTFVASLAAPLSRRRAWALHRYVRLRHSRQLVLDAAGEPAREALCGWLEAIATDGSSALEMLIFRGCRFHRDDRGALDAVAEHATGVAFVGGLPRRLSAFAELDTLALGCRSNDGPVPASALEALAESGVAPRTLALELSHDDTTSVPTDALLRWLTSVPPGRIRRLSLAGCAPTLLKELAEAGVAPDRVRWQGRLDRMQLEAVVDWNLPFELAVQPAEGSERGLAGAATERVRLLTDAAPVCPWSRHL